jgi:hypothetical protein
MKKLKVFNEENVPNTSGTGLAGYIDTTYNKLLSVLGEPTFNSPSGDSKVQVEWVLEFEGKLFSIYDWKTYDRNYTENILDRFNIGSKVNTSSLVIYLQKLINK